MRWQDIEDDREKYAAYLCSREWSVLKNAVHERAGGICERCKRFQIDAVHHMTYARKYFEDLEDLQGLCNGCHAFTHGKSNDDPNVLPAARIVSDGREVVIEVGEWRYDFDTSVGMSLLHGLIDIEDIRRRINLMAEVAEQVRRERSEG